jgi:hypothetical protein
MIQAQTVFEYNGQSEASREITKIWQKMSDHLG